MAVKLLVVGKTKEKFFMQSEQEYLKRLRPMVKLDYTSLKASKLDTDRDKCLQQEEDSILKAIKDSDHVVLLDENGVQYSSRKFAASLNQWLVNKANVVFVIGGAFGFSEAVKQRANDTLSLSKMTMPHHLVRTVFLEQLYRAFTILKGGKYHND